MAYKVAPVCSWLLKKIAGILAPSFCVSCRLFLKDDTILCPECMRSIHPVVSTKISITAKQEIIVFALSSYQGPVKKLIQAKYHGNPLASRQLADLLWEKTALSHLVFDGFVPIPLHWTRYAKRGFNQAEVMANQLSKKSGKPVFKNLSRISKTKSQVQLVKEEREKNVQNVFVLHDDEEILKGKTLILVDDLMTTGSTLKEAGRVLLKAKVAQLYAIVGARVI